MDGFVASGRIEQARPRLAGRRGEAEPARWPFTVAIQTAPSEVVDVHQTAALGGRLAAVRDRWLAFRDRWSELTFYLFDPQSWR
jgi:hypothetical protein